MGVEAPDLIAYLSLGLGIFCFIKALAILIDLELDRS
jgi:hypothetical protein